MKDRYNFATEMMIEVVVFYIGVAIFVGICMMPPLTLMLPYILPVTFLICIIVNISFIVRFTKGTNKEITKVTDIIQEQVNLDLM